jgi:hypothetical protein
MDPIRTHQELLLDLAGSGDPTAFYTLIAQYASAAYIVERNAGKSHKEALSLLIPFIKTAYQDFIKTSPHKAFDIWYREYKRNYFASAQESSEEVNLSEKSDFGNIPMADIAHFDRILELILQRKYGKIQRVWNGRLVGKSRRFIRLIKTAALIVSICIVFILFYCFLAIKKQRIILTYSFKDSSMSMAFPFSSKASSNATGLFQKNTSPQDGSLSDSGKMRSPVVHDTLKMHDTVRVFSRWNAVSQSKVPTVSSPGIANAGSQINKPAVPSVIAGKPAASSAPSPSSSVPPSSATPSPASPTMQGSIKNMYDSLQ